MIQMETRQLDVDSDIAAIDTILDVFGLSLVDVGCGPGDLSRALVERGAQVLAIDPDPKQAAVNAAADTITGLTFCEAPAQSIPAGSASMDGVVFSRSLHHVPSVEMDAALREAERVLKPGSGFLFVLEPEMTGSYYELMKPFHDETQVRRQARDALRRVADLDFSRCETYAYETLSNFVDFNQFRERIAARTYLDIDLGAVDAPEIRQTFENGRRGSSYLFTAPHWVGLYRGLKTTRSPHID